MEARNVIELAAVLMGEDDMVEIVQAGIFGEDGDTDKLTDKGHKTVDLLLECLDSVVQEICVDYAKIRCSTVYDVKNGEFDLSDFAENECVPIVGINYIVNTESLLRLPFMVDGETVKITDGAFSDGEVIVDYNMLLNVSSLEDDLAGLAELGITERILAYGVAATYKTIKGNEGEALYWERLYCDALEDITGIRAGVLNPKRRRLHDIDNLVG